MLMRHTHSPRERACGCKQVESLTPPNTLRYNGTICREIRVTELAQLPVAASSDLQTDNSYFLLHILT